MKAVCNNFLYALYVLYGVGHSLKRHVRGGTVPVLLTGMPLIAYVGGFGYGLDKGPHAALVFGSIPFTVIGLRWLVYYTSTPEDGFVRFMARIEDNPWSGLWLYGTFALSCGFTAWLCLNPSAQMAADSFHLILLRVTALTVLGLIPSAIAVAAVGAPLLGLIKLTIKTVDYQARKGRALRNGEDPECVEW